VTTTPKQSKLSRLAEQLFAQARRRGGTHRVPLPGGAQLSITVNGEKTVMVFSREWKKLGDTELTTFFHHCGVPERARRVPEVGQAYQNGFYVVGWMWEDGEDEL
jgi:hypothetical protein